MNYKWYFFSILGLLLIGTGLCIFGEALIRKINQENFFWHGTTALIIFNSGICFVGEAIFIRRKKTGQIFNRYYYFYNMDILDFENSTYSVNLRKLTRKSRLGFGYRDIKDITIQDILIMNKHKELIKIYFGLGKINFVDDILDELGISEDMRIPKPGKIADYEERDKIVAKALKVVKERKKEEVAAFRKMAQEMREQQK